MEEHIFDQRRPTKYVSTKWWKSWSISSGFAQAVLHKGLDLKVRAWWVPKQASVEDVVSGATEQFLLGRYQEACWTIPEVHPNMKWQQCRKVTSLYFISGTKGVVWKLPSSFTFEQVDKSDGLANRVLHVTVVRRRRGRQTKAEWQYRRMDGVTIRRLWYTTVTYAGDWWTVQHVSPNDYFRG